MSTSIFNPFKGRVSKEVWEEIRREKKPITREEALKQMRDNTAKKSNK